MKALRLISRLLLAMLFAFVPMFAGSSNVSAQSAVERIKQEGTLKIGWAVWLPYVFNDPAARKLRGSSVDLGEALGRRLGVKVEWVEESWATIVAGLQAKKFDITIPLARTPQRMKSILLSEPVMQYGQVLLVPKADIGKYKTWHDLDSSDVKITTTLGTTSDDLRKALPKAQIFFTKDGPTSLNEILTGKAHAWAYTTDGLREVVKKRNDVVIVPGEPYGVHQISFGMRQEDVDLVKLTNQFIVEIEQNGELLRILKQYDQQDDYIFRR